MDHLLPANVRSLARALSTDRATTPADLRRSLLAHAGEAADGPPPSVPAELASYVDKVARWAYKVTDEDFERLRAAGYDDDAIFEITLCTAVGAGLARFERGLAAVAEDP